MPSVTVENEAVFPSGTEVGAYPVSNWPRPDEPSGEPLGSASDEAEVEDGALDLTLTAGDYWLVGEVGSAFRYLRHLVVESEVAGGIKEVAEDYTVTAEDDGKTLLIEDPGTEQAEEEQTVPKTRKVIVPAGLPAGMEVAVVFGSGVMSGEETSGGTCVIEDGGNGSQVRGRTGAASLDNGTVLMVNLESSGNLAHCRLLNVGQDKWLATDVGGFTGEAD